MFHLYGLLVGIAIVAAWSVGEARDSRVNKIFPWVMSFGLLGARAYHVIDWWEYYSSNLVMVLSVWNGGLGIWGGIAGGLLGFWFGSNFYRYHHKDELLAAIVMGLPLGQAIGRLGNAASGEFGERVGSMPWWAAEMCLDLILFGVIFRVSKLGNHQSKRIVGTYLVGYGLIRFGLEFWRTNSWKVASFGVAQWVSILSIVIGLLICRMRVHD